MKDVLALITPMSDSSLGSAGDYALNLASRMGAHLTILLTQFEPIGSGPFEEPDNMQSCGDVAHSPATWVDRAARTTELAYAAARQSQVRCTVLNLPGENGSQARELLIDKAQVHDCTIVGVQGPLRYPKQGVVEGMLFGSGRPIILTPLRVLPPTQEKILVAWDASRSAVRALHDALPILVHASEVLVVLVTGDRKFRAIESGPEVCHYLSRWNVKSRFELLERGDGGVGGALLEYATQVRASLLVMGGFGHAREREFLFGSATQDIFKANLDLAVLLSH